VPSRISQDGYKQALARGREALAQPHAVSARYVTATHALELVYSNGLTLRFDTRGVPLLEDVPKNALSHPYVTPGGDGLVFGESEFAVSLPGLVARLIPIDVARRAVASARGRVRSSAKAEAARRNGLKGGRPSGRAIEG
jgi:hypothetical protein